MTPIIEVKNLSKQYRIGQRQRYLSLRDALVDTFKFRQNNSKAIETDVIECPKICFDGFRNTGSIILPKFECIYQHIAQAQIALTLPDTVLFTQIFDFNNGCHCRKVICFI